MHVPNQTISKTSIPSLLILAKIILSIEYTKRVGWCSLGLTRLRLVNFCPRRITNLKVSISWWHRVGTTRSRIGVGTHLFFLLDHFPQNYWHVLYSRIQDLLLYIPSILTCFFYSSSSYCIYITNLGISMYLIIEFALLSRTNSHNSLKKTYAF